MVSVPAWTTLEMTVSGSPEEKIKIIEAFSRLYVQKNVNPVVASLQSYWSTIDTTPCTGLDVHYLTG